MRTGVRYFSGYEEGGDLVRVTGYLVKKSELLKIERGEASHNQATVLGVGQKYNAKALTRKLHTIDE